MPMTEFNGAGQTTEERKAHLDKVAKNREEVNKSFRRIARECGFDYDNFKVEKVFPHFYPPLK